MPLVRANAPQLLQPRPRRPRPVIPARGGYVPPSQQPASTRVQNVPGAYIAGRRMTGNPVVPGSAGTGLFNRDAFNARMASNPALQAAMKRQALQQYMGSQRGTVPPTTPQQRIQARRLTRQGKV